MSERETQKLFQRSRSVSHMMIWKFRKRNVLAMCRNIWRKIVSDYKTFKALKYESARSEEPKEESKSKKSKSL